jgi:hypothetical protein
MGLALAVVAVLLLSACQDWAQFMGDAGHDGNDSAETIIGPGNVAKLHEVFSIPGVNEPVNFIGVTVANGDVYAASGNGMVVASVGSAGCSGTPKVCQPLWTAPSGLVGPGGISQPVVAGGVVYQSSDGVKPGDLRAFDANGVNNCSGTPLVCQPLWTAAAPSDSGPVVDGGYLFINSDGTLMAFDANGVNNCSGTPVVCQPLWTASVPARWIPTVADGKVYVATGTAPYELEAFDERGVTNCSGAPTVCQPLFTATLPGAVKGSVAVSGGTAYVETPNGQVAAVDAAGVTNCSGTPVVCQPLWTSPALGAGLANDGATVAIANGRVYVLAGGAPSGAIFVLDAAGVTGCSGTPTVCQPIGSSPGAPLAAVGPTYSNGLLWLGGQAWDANALASCGPPPASLCSPVRNLGASNGPTAISLGTVFVNTGTEIDAYQI